MPYEQHPQTATSLNLLVRTAVEPGSVEETLRRKLHNISPDVPSKFTTVQAELSESVAAPRFRALLVAAFAALALVLAMAGIYGVMAYSVAERTREIGIRMALGAQTSGVVRLVLGQGMKLVGVGLALGLAGALAATRVLASLLFEVKPADPVAFIGASPHCFALPWSRTTFRRSAPRASTPWSRCGTSDRRSLFHKLRKFLMLSLASCRLTFRHFRERFFSSGLYLFLRVVVLARPNRPEVPERIRHLGVSIAPECIHQRHFHLRARCNGFGKRRVGIGGVNVQRHRGSVQR
jgi:hypothetical protein